MDFKSSYACREGPCQPLALVDDHSRYALGVFALKGTARGPVQSVLRETFQAYGLPEAMLIDHGVPWWSTTNGYGLTRLGVALIRQGIQLCWGPRLSGRPILCQ